MTPEVKSAMELFTKQACTISMTGDRVSVQCDSRLEAESIFDFLESLANPFAEIWKLIDQHTQQPVDWPTEPGWWWMDIPSRESIICMANGGDVWLKGVNGVTYSKTECDRRGARFLPLFIPTFPPREER